MAELLALAMDNDKGETRDINACPALPRAPLAIPSYTHQHYVEEFSEPVITISMYENGESRECRTAVISILGSAFLKSALH